MVRAKMQVSSIENHANWSGKTVKLTTVYDPNIPEDQRFCKATPSGTISMTVDNPAALEQLPLGKHFYVDFVPVPES